MKKDVLESYLNQQLSTREIAKRLGKSQSNVMYWIRKHELSANPKPKQRNFCLECVSEINLQSRFCGNTCFANSKAKHFGEKWIREGQGVLPRKSRDTGLFSGKSRRFVFIKYNNSCQVCGWAFDFGDGSFAPLEIHHIDGDYKNNNFNNLKLLCPNCHAVENRLNPVKNGNGRWTNGDDSRSPLV